MRKIYIIIMSGLMGLSVASIGAQALSSFNHQAGFVVPVTTYVNKGTRTDYVILSREAGGSDKGTYDAFGGKRDKEDGNHPVTTAAREFFEEAITVSTLGKSEKQMKDYIDLKNGNTRHIFAVCSKSGSGRNVLYMTGFSHTDFNNLINKFANARASKTRNRYKEKDRIAKIRLSDLRAAISRAGSHHGVTVKAEVTDLKGKTTTKTITLRPVLAKMLSGYSKGSTYQTGKDRKIRFYRF